MEVYNILTELVEKFGNNYQYEIIEESDILTLSRIRVTCLKHKTSYDAIYINLLHMLAPCEDCEIDITLARSIKLNGKRKVRDVDALIKDFKLKHGDRFSYIDLYDEYENMKTKVWIKCKKHSVWFKQTPINHLNTEICCPNCTEEISKFTKEVDT